MKHRLLQWLACPSCRSPHLALQTRRAENRPTYIGLFEPEEADLPGLDLGRREEIEVIEGALHCQGCGAVYPIREGVPRMLPRGVEEGASSAHRWTTFDTAYPAWEDSFLDYAAPLKPPDFLGKLVLDAGCGFGRHAYYAARYGAEVVAMDAGGDAIASAAANTQHLSRVHLVQGDLRHPPFREECFDMVLSFGVLHYLDQPDEALATLTGVLRAGGRLSVWVYGPRQGTTAAATNALRGAASGLEPEELHRVSSVIASGLRVFSHTPYKILQHVPIAKSIVSHLPVHDHHKWPYPVVVADIYDRIRNPVRHWFTHEELEVWFTEKGFLDVAVTRRVKNNETFRATGVRR